MNSHPNTTQPKKYHFNLQDSSYYISLNITKKKPPTHLSDSNLQRHTNSDPNNKVNFMNQHYDLPLQRAKSRLEKILDYNDTNLFSQNQRKYQFINPMREFFNANPSNTIQNKLNFLNSNNGNETTASKKYQLGVSKQTHHSHLNVSLESTKKQNQMYRIEISPANSGRQEYSAPHDKFQSIYLDKLKKYSQKYCHEDGSNGGGATKIEIGTSNDLKLRQLNRVPLSSRSNYTRDFIDEFALKSSRNTGKFSGTLTDFLVAEGDWETSPFSDETLLFLLEFFCFFINHIQVYRFQIKRFI